MKQISRYLGATLLAGIADEVSDLHITPSLDSVAVSHNGQPVVDPRTPEWAMSWA